MGLVEILWALKIVGGEGTVRVRSVVQIVGYVMDAELSAE